MNLIAFHGKESIKRKYLDRLAAHRKADELVQGVGWENGKGCLVGCTLESYDHARYETELGIPQMIARLFDVIFEGLPNGDAQAWPERSLSAIRPGADLSLVGWKFLAWLVPTTLERYGKEVAKECQDAVAILVSLSQGQKVLEFAGERAASAARSAERAAGSAEHAARSVENAASREMADKLVEFLASA